MSRGVTPRLVKTSAFSLVQLPTVTERATTRMMRCGWSNDGSQRTTTAP